MALTGATNAEKIWNFLRSKGFNAFGTAGIMGNLEAESSLNPCNLEDRCELRWGISDSTYTTRVDSGSYSKDRFTDDAAGYGLAQWTSPDRKKNLYEYARKYHVSIGNLEMQLNFLFQELQGSYDLVYHTCRNAKSVREASDMVLLKFEIPLYRDTNVQEERERNGWTYYNRYYSNKVVPYTSFGKKYIPRLERPVGGNLYYKRIATGGWCPAIKGSPMDSQCDVLANCVGYAIGRFNEIGEYGYCKYLTGGGNAENFWVNNPSLPRGKIPKLGACMVWQKGLTQLGGDGAGHVAIVEKVISDTEVLTSESGYDSKAFWTQTRSKGADGNWGQNSKYKFLGFLYNPAVTDDVVVSEEGIGGATIGRPVYDTTSTREDASFREVGYLKSTGEPSINRTDIKLSVVNYTNMLSFLNVITGSEYDPRYIKYDLDLSKVKDQNCRIAISFFISKGMNIPCSIALTANIKSVSDFKTYTYDTKSDRIGIYKWTGQDKKNLKKECNDWRTNLTGQLEFFWNNLNDSYIHEKLKSSILINTVGQAVQASDLIVAFFQRPRNVSYAKKESERLVRSLWSQIVILEGSK